MSSCVNDDFADYLDCWKHNGYWLFDSPEMIQQVAREKSVSLEGARLFFYEAFEMEFDEKQMSWTAFLDRNPVLGRMLSFRKRIGWKGLIWLRFTVATRQSVLRCLAVP